MRLPAHIADLLISHQAYRVCPLLTTDEFVRFCKERAVGVDAERLRRLERLRLFRPLLRVCRFEQVHKVEYIEDGARYRDLGPIQTGEVWDGDTRTELAAFSFEAQVVQSWREYGYLWDPSANDSSHADTIDTDSRRHQAYYSRFQIQELAQLLLWLTQAIHLELTIEDGSSQAAEWTKYFSGRLAQISQWAVERQGTRALNQLQGPLCQLISDRYYPKTQTDERRITFTAGIPPHDDWDWHKYARDWNASAIVEEFALSADELKRLYEQLAFTQRHIDPLEKWYDLVRFVSVEKRRKLKGDALKAMVLREMAQMLRLFHRDAFGENLHPPSEIGHTIIHRIPDVDPEEDPLRALELVANGFGINPKPQLVLLLEGATEVSVVPLILDRLFGVSPGALGIELLDLGGVSNAAGGKENPFSAVWRLVDYLHHHQILVFVLMDNEGGYTVRNIVQGLSRASSIHFPDRRATRREYIKLWKLSFELDNFSDAEISRALTDFAGGVAFSRADVAVCRESARNPPKRGKVRTLEVLYAERAGTRLNKPAFGHALIDVMFSSVTKRSPTGRPIARFLSKVVYAAARNHQPTTHAMWEYNQRTGYVGTLRPGAVSRRKRPF